jgi:hypothetical protein
MEPSATPDNGRSSIVAYTVTPADFAAGDTWRVSLTAFSPLNVEGTVNLTYP